MADDGAAWAAEPGGVAIFVRLTPKGGRDGFDGLETLADGKTVLKARVRAAPEDGKANAALVALLAKMLKAPKSSVKIASGETSRVKKIFVDGDPAPLIDALTKSLACAKQG